MRALAPLLGLIGGGSYEPGRIVTLTEVRAAQPVVVREYVVQTVVPRRETRVMAASRREAKALGASRLRMPLDRVIASRAGGVNFGTELPGSARA